MQNAEHRAIEEHQTNEHTVKHTLWFNPLPHSVQPKTIFQNTPNIAHEHEACTTDVRQRSDHAIEIFLHKQIHFF